MKGYLFDENLPSNIQFTTKFSVTHVSTLGQSLSDTQIWEYATQNDLAIVSKDVDFSDRIIIALPPPRVIHLRFGNMRKNDFHLFLANMWPMIEERIPHHRLINVYIDRIETVK